MSEDRDVLEVEFRDICFPSRQTGRPVSESMKLCRVALIAHCYHESSARHKLAFLAQNTDFRLISPQYYPYPYGRREIDYEFNREVAVCALPIHFLSPRPTSTRWILESRDLGFREFKPDIIHVENEQHSWILCQALLYRKLYAPSAKMVVFVWDNIYPSEQDSKARLLEHLARINRRFVDFFICGNAAGKEILIQKGVPASRVEVIPQFGVDTGVFHPFTSDQRLSVRSEMDISPDEFAVGFVGRFVEEKGLLDLVEAMTQLHTATNRQVVLILVGTGPLETPLRETCTARGIRLLVLPPCRNDEVVAAMNSLDVLVLPSRSRSFWKEQFGRVLIEAMACGVPVIGSSSGEIPNVIGDAGLVFKEGDSAQLCEKLKLYCDDEGFRTACALKGLQRVLNSFTNERIAQRTLAVYERVAAS